MVLKLKSDILWSVSYVVMAYKYSNIRNEWWSVDLELRVYNRIGICAAIYIHTYIYIYICMYVWEYRVGVGVGLPLNVR